MKSNLTAPPQPKLSLNRVYLFTRRSDLVTLKTNVTRDTKVYWWALISKGDDEIEFSWYLSSLKKPFSRAEKHLSCFEIRSLPLIFYWETASPLDHWLVLQINLTNSSSCLPLPPMYNLKFHPRLPVNFTRIPGNLCVEIFVKVDLSSPDLTIFYSA